MNATNSTNVVVTGGVGLQYSDDEDDTWQKDPGAKYGSCSDFHCSTCGFQGVSALSLKIHLLKRHGTQRTATTNNSKKKKRNR